MDLEILAYKQYASVSKYTGNAKEVVIPERYKGVPVTKIQKGAFSRNTHIEAVFLPGTLQTIEADAFAACSHLKYVGCTPAPEGTIDADSKNTPKQTHTAGEYPPLSQFPAALRTIGDRAFIKTTLNRVEFKSHTLNIGASAFERCRRLSMVTLYNCKDLSMDKRAFMSSGITRFYAPFIKAFALPEQAFAYCTNLKSVLMQIKSVGERCFYGCLELEELFLPKPLESVGSDAFFCCDKLREIEPTLPCPPKPPASEPAHEKFETSLPDILDHVPVPIPRKRAAETDTIKYDISFDHSKPLFHMSINCSGEFSRTIPIQIKGVLKKKEELFRFRIQTPASLEDISLSPVSDQNLTCITPVLNYIQSKEVPIILLGKQEEKLYAVYEIFPLPSSPFAQEFPRHFFREIIRRLQRPVPQDAALKPPETAFTMRRTDEFDTFAEICRDQLPGWVFDAYQRNKDILRPSSGFGSDEKKHATRAQELLLNIDWTPKTPDVPTTDEAREILDRSFFGLDEVKDRIQEVVAQIRRTGTLPKWGILLHGPAGTGKTSIAKAIAKTLKMSIIHMDMSAIGEDPETISGSSRIYSNARPGQLLDGMYKIRASTALLLVNEIDKATGKRQPASDALLTILDKTGFPENFLEVILPTDNLFCIGTCNDLDRIAKPLRDRFLVIDIPGYTPNEKKVIWKDYVLPRAMENSGITPQQLDVTDDASDLLVSQYALEPGVRDLEKYAERLTGNYCRHAEVGGQPTDKRIYTAEDIKALFGPERSIVRSFAINPGEINAAFYHDGAAHFFLVEASVLPGTGKFEVLGPLAKIQEDYCKAAYWCVRNTTSCDLSKLDVSVFVPHPLPQGADNYVGLACYAAICSKLLKINLAIHDICFIGGCDMNGSLYFDENNLTPLLRAMKARGVTTLYAPMGTTRLVDAKTNSDCKVTIIEAPDAKTLFSLAAARNALKH